MAERSDTERLDWLEKMQGWQGKPSDIWKVAVEIGTGCRRASFRQAIDAAMDAEETTDGT